MNLTLRKNFINRRTDIAIIFNTQYFNNFQMFITFEYIFNI